MLMLRAGLEWYAKQLMMLLMFDSKKLLGVISEDIAEP